MSVLMASLFAPLINLIVIRPRTSRRGSARSSAWRAGRQRERLCGRGGDAAETLNTRGCSHDAGNVKASAPPGLHDDIVMALAFATWTPGRCAGLCSGKCRSRGDGVAGWVRTRGDSPAGEVCREGRIGVSLGAVFRTRARGQPVEADSR